jgi:spermidine/putrescine transport system substrate-binding protein
MVLTDWMAGRLIQLEWLKELDQANIPNMSNLRASLQDVTFDPDRAYSLPWQSGMTGIGVNPTAVDKEITSINDLFDESLAGRVTMLTEMRDTTSLVMAGMGINPTDQTLEEHQQVVDNELIFPSEELLANAFDFKPLNEEEQTQYQDAFQAVIGA